MEQAKGLYKLRDIEQTDQSVLTRCPGEAKAPHHGCVPAPVDWRAPPSGMPRLHAARELREPALTVG